MKIIVINDITFEVEDRHVTTIERALAWLDKNEPKWGLETPIDRVQFMLDLLGWTR